MKLRANALGAVALGAWTLLGLLAWGRVAQLAAVPPEEDARSQANPEVAALADEVSTLHGDLQAVASTFAQNLQNLQDNLEQGERERSESMTRELVALREDVRRQLDALAAAKEAPAASERGGEVSREETPSEEPPRTATPGEDPTIAEKEKEKEKEKPSEPPGSDGDGSDGKPGAEKGAEKADKGKKSFLAFQLPSDAFQFEGRRTWTLLPSLSRVGFDGESTLHDFSGATSQLAGEMEFDPSKPGDAPRARITVKATSLDTGNEDRDADMRKSLGNDEHPEIQFELERFEPSSVDAKAMRVAGTASGTMTIHGTKQKVSMPVNVSVDEAHRLAVQGEMPLSMSKYGVSVPSALGVIKMKDEVKVWISLKLRAGAKK